LKSRSNNQIALKPQDLLVLFKICGLRRETTTYAKLAEELALSVSEVHASVRRADVARLLTLSEGIDPIRASIKEFVLYGAKYAFPGVLGAVTRGMPTAYAAPPLSQEILQTGELPPIWPDPRGEQRGVALYPLYPTVPIAARKDSSLYEALALFDSLRIGAARERERAAQLLDIRLS
jgi:hypothetical protein